VCGVSRDTIKRRLRAGRLPSAFRADTERGPQTGPWMIPWVDLAVAGLDPVRSPTAATTAPDRDDACTATSSDPDALRAQIAQLRIERAAAEARASALQQALALAIAALGSHPGAGRLHGLETPGRSLPSDYGQGGQPS